jgi:hypothetical protein
MFSQAPGTRLEIRCEIYQLSNARRSSWRANITPRTRCGGFSWLLPLKATARLIITTSLRLHRWVLHLIMLSCVLNVPCVLFGVRRYLQQALGHAKGIISARSIASFLECPHIYCLAFGLCLVERSAPVERHRSDRVLWHTFSFKSATP